VSTSIFIARLIGPVMLVIGLAVLTNQRAFREMADEFLASRALLFLSGLLIMPVGLAIVLTHNVWTADWRVLITLLGWLTAIGGAAAVWAAVCGEGRPRHAEKAVFHIDRRRDLGRGRVAVLLFWILALKEPDLRKGETP